MSKWQWIRRQALLGAIIVPALVVFVDFLSGADLASDLVAAPLPTLAWVLALAAIGALLGAGVGALRKVTAENR